MPNQPRHQPANLRTRLRDLVSHGRYRATIAVSTLALAATGVWGGCSSAPVAHRPAHTPTAAQARSWEAVLAPTGSSLADAHAWESDRNTHRLAARTDEPLSVAADWPERERPRLDRSRRLTLPRDANQIIYFRTESESRSTTFGSHNSWWY